MTERQRFTLWEPVQAHKIITMQLWPLLKSMLMAGQRVVVEIKPETRVCALPRLSTLTQKPGR
jgi:hypothetical protein